MRLAQLTPTGHQHPRPGMVTGTEIAGLSAALGNACGVLERHITFNGHTRRHAHPAADLRASPVGLIALTAGDTVAHSHTTTPESAHGSPWLARGSPCSPPLSDSLPY